MLGETGTEQFTIITKIDGKVIREQLIHDPFLHNKTVVGFSRWNLLCGLFKRKFEVTVEISVEGTQGIQRAVMMLDPEAIAKDTEQILADRKLSRERFNDGNCQAFVAK